VRENSFFPALLAACALGGVFALWLMTGGQPGLVNDSAAYIGGADSLLSGHGFSFPYRVGEWTPIVHFPPFYALLIAGAAGLAGISPGQAAYALNLFLFGMNITLAGLLVWRLTRNRVWTLFAALLTAASPGLLWTHAFVLSEPLFLCVFLAFLHVIHAYIRGLSRLALLSAASLAVLGFWTRYTGAAFYLSGALAILFYSPCRSWRLHLRDLGWFLAVGVPGALLLVLRNTLTGGTLANRLLLWHPPGMAKWLEGAHHLWGFFMLELPEAWVIPAAGFALLVVLGGLVIAAGPVLGRARHTFSNRHPLQGAALIAMQGCTYLVVVILAMIFFDASTIFEARIMAPFALCLLLAGLAALSDLQTRLKGRLQVIPPAAAAAFLMLTLMSGANLVRTSRWDGLGFSAAYWRNSTTFQALETLPEVNLYSTRPMGIYLLSDRPATFIPDAYNPVTGQEAQEQAEKIEQMRREVLQGQAVVVIFEYPSMTVNPYEVEWARRVTAGLPLLVMLPDGAIHGDLEKLGLKNGYANFEDVR
jgi:4-amino-4-deoxy-L-arabinose transferase-like glycosyltransferase